MARKGANISILHFGSTFIAWLRVKPSASGVDVETSKIERVPLSDEEGGLPSALTAFVRANGIAEDRVFTVLPRYEATLRVLELPSQSEDEIQGMVQLTAEEIAPYPLEELITGHCVLDKLAGESSRVLVAVLHENVIASHMELLRGAGIVPERIYLSTACLLSALEKGQERDVAALDVSPGGMEFLALREGGYAFGRAVSFDEPWQGEHPDAVNIQALEVELRRSVTSFERERGAQTESGTLSVSSSCYSAADLAERLSALEGQAGAHAMDMQSLSPGAGACADAPAVLLGAALSAQDDAAYVVDLLPKSEVARRAAAFTRTKVARIAAMAVLGMLAMGAVFGQSIMQRLDYIATLEQQAEELRPVARSVRAKRQQLRRVQQQVGDETTVLEYLDAIVALAPAKGLNVTLFRYDREEGIELRGRAIEPSSFDGLIDALRGSTSYPQFAQASEMYRTVRSERNKEVWDFAVSIPFPGSEEGDGDE